MICPIYTNLHSLTCSTYQPHNLIWKSEYLTTLEYLLIIILYIGNAFIVTLKSQKKCAKWLHFLQAVFLKTVCSLKSVLAL